MMSSIPVGQVADEYRRQHIRAAQVVRAEVRMIGPNEAATLLTANTLNRPMGLGTKNYYRDMILNGHYLFNGQPIILGEDGTLLDGQHRLQAIVDAEIAVPVLVVVGVPHGDKAFQTLDTGRKRSVADTLATLGEGQISRVLSSALRWLYAYYTQQMLNTNAIRLTNAQYVDLLNQNPGLRASAEYINRRAEHGIHQPGPFAFLHYACTRKHPEHADFFDRLLSGAGQVEGSPEWLISRWLRNQRVGRTSSELTATTIAMVIKGWNATVMGFSPRLIRWSRSEPFPVIE